MAARKSKNKTAGKTERKTYGPSNLQIAFLIVSAILILSMVLSLIKI